MREGPNGLEFKDPKTGKWHPLDEARMVEFPRSAADYWNQEGVLHGPGSPQVRQWNLDPSNYRLEHPSSIPSGPRPVFNPPPGG